MQCGLKEQVRLTWLGKEEVGKGCGMSQQCDSSKCYVWRGIDHSIAQWFSNCVLWDPGKHSKLMGCCKIANYLRLVHGFGPGAL